MSIHPTAIIDSKAQLAQNVSIGAYTIIDADVSIDEGTQIGHHCVVTGRTHIGKNNAIYHSCSIGEAPQDKKYNQEPTQLIIGDNNTIREFCTFNTGTIQDEGITSLGDNNWLMAYVHLAHDCRVGNNTIFANNAQIAGHVVVEDFAILGAFTAVHQFCRIGTHSMSGMGTILLQDVLPYTMVSGNPAGVYGINTEGLKRRGFSSDRIREIKSIYKIIYRNQLTINQARDEIQQKSYEDTSLILNFLEKHTRGLVR